MVLGALKGSGYQLPGAQEVLNGRSLPRGASRGRLRSRMAGSLEAWPSGWQGDVFFRNPRMFCKGSGELPGSIWWPHLSLMLSIQGPFSSVYLHWLG